MKWLPLPVVAITAAACLTALTSPYVHATSRSHRKVLHKKSSVSRAPAYTDHLILQFQERSNADAPAPIVEPLAAPGSRGENIARTALSYRGAPYRFGGRSERSGFDCSGLVQAVCAKWGIFLPRVAGAQFTKGAPVQQSDLQPGDLVFFKNTYKSGLSHVGIFIGEGQFVHAAGRQKGVKISNLADAFYQQHWAGARRLNLKQLPPVSDESTFAAPQAADVTIEAPMTMPTKKVPSAWQPRPYHDEMTGPPSLDARMAGEGTTTGRRFAPPRIR